MKAINWELVDDGGSGFTDLPNGGYVCKVVEVIDEEDYTNNWGDTYDRIVIRWDVAEGPEKDFFFNNSKPDFTHEHEFRYNPANCGESYSWQPEQFKAFWSKSLEGGWDCGSPMTMKGKKFGATVRHRHYTKQSGEDGSVIQFQGFYSVDAIREGKFKKPVDVDKRKPVKKQDAPSAAYEENLPF